MNCFFSSFSKNNLFFSSFVFLLTQLDCSSGIAMDLDAPAAIGQDTKDSSAEEISHKEKVKLLTTRALQGDARAQYKLGNIYVEGKYGIEVNAKEALEWFIKSAEQNYLSAIYFVGSIYRYGEGNVDKDYTRSVYWLKKGAEQGDTYCQNTLAGMYQDGLGVSGGICDENNQQAVKLYEEAAKKDNRMAQYNLGMMYKEGICGGQPNRVLALDFFKKSADNGYCPAMRAVSTFYEDRELEKALYWLTKAGDTKDKDFIKSHYSIHPAAPEAQNKDYDIEFVEILTGKTLKEGEECSSGLHYLLNKYNKKAAKNREGGHNQFSIPTLYSKYDAMAEQISRAVVSVEYFHAPESGFMLRLNNISNDLENQLYSVNSSSCMSYIDIGRYVYLNFGEKNVKQAENLKKFLYCTSDEIESKFQERAKGHKKLLKNKLNELEGEQSVLEILQNTASGSAEFLEKSRDFAKQRKNFEDLQKILEAEIKEIEEKDIVILKNAVGKIEDLIKIDAPRRNAKFAEEYPIMGATD